MQNVKYKIWQGERYSLKQQVLNFEEDLTEIKALFNHDDDYDKFLSKSIVVMVLGSNDYVNNYLLPTLYTSSRTYTPEQYANLLLNEYTRQILVCEIVLVYSHKFWSEPMIGMDCLTGISICMSKKTPKGMVTC